MQKSDIMINLPTMGQRDHNNIKEPYGGGGGGGGGEIRPQAKSSNAIPFL